MGHYSSQNVSEAAVMQLANRVYKQHADEFSDGAHLPSIHEQALQCTCARRMPLVTFVAAGMRLVRTAKN